jgi:hypothetical protein
MLFSCLKKHPLTFRLFSFSASAVVGLPKTVEVDSGKVETVCDQNNPEWREAQTIEGVI